MSETIEYEIDVGGWYGTRADYGEDFEVVSGYPIGWFGIRYRGYGCWRIDHLPTGLKLPHDFKSANDAARVCLELTGGRLDWGFTKIPMKGVGWWSPFQRQYKRLIGDPDA